MPRDRAPEFATICSGRDGCFMKSGTWRRVSPQTLLGEPRSSGGGSALVATEKRVGWLAFGPRLLRRYLRTLGLRNCDAWNAEPRRAGKKVGVITLLIKPINDDVQGGHDTANAFLAAAAPIVHKTDNEAARKGPTFIFSRRRRRGQRESGEARAGGYAIGLVRVRPSSWPDTAASRSGRCRAQESPRATYHVENRRGRGRTRSHCQSGRAVRL